MADAEATNTPPDMKPAQQDDRSPLVDPSILKEKRIMIVRDLDVEPVLAGMKPFLVNHFSNVNAINAEPDHGKKTGMLLDFLQRFSVKEFAKFNTFLKIIGGTQPDLFLALVGREPSATEVDFCIQNCAENMKECIKGQGHSVDSPLDETIDFTVDHVQLAITRDKPESETNDDFPHRYQTHLSNVEEKEDYVSAAEVLASAKNEEKPKCVSLYGRAGTGKSTTFQWLAREWSFNRWAAEFTLIFLLQLRMLAISDFQITAVELLTLHSLYQVEEPDFVRLLTSWLKHSGAKLIILLDGLDEISGFSTRFKNCRKITNLNQKAPPLDICINILRGNLLPGATVITASRPFAGLSAVQYDRQLEILGLTESRVSEMVERKHPTKAVHIISVLRTNPLLMSISGITFYCVLISRLLADGVVFDSGELQTYTRLTAFIVVQYVSRKLSDWSFVLEVSSYFPKLASLAYEGIFEAQMKKNVSKLVFNEYDLSKAELTPQRLKSVLETGLLQTKQVKVGLRSSVIAEFIHLSVQEMLASAYLLSNLSLSDNIFSRLFAGGQFNMALLYLFGLQYDTGSSWIKDIRHSVNPSGQGLSTAAEQPMDDFIQALTEQCGGKADFSSQFQVCQLLYEGQMEDKARCVVRDIVPSGKLTIQNTQMTLIDLMAVWFVCKYAEAITEITLIKCGLTDTVIKFLTSTLLKVNKGKLQVLNLAYNNIGVEGAEAIAEWLKENNTLLTLTLEGCNIGDIGAAAVATVLQTNNTLQTLILQGGSNMCNRIADHGARAIAATLQSNTSLHTLDVGGNYMSCGGVTLIALALKTNTSLHTLDVGGNCIGVSGAMFIAEAIRANRTLQTLNIHGNLFSFLGEGGAKTIASALDLNRTLRSLDISCNKIGDIGATTLSATLTSNFTIQALNVSYNNIGANGLRALKGRFGRCRIRSDSQIGVSSPFPRAFARPVYL